MREKPRMVMPHNDVRPGLPAAMSPHERKAEWGARREICSVAVPIVSLFVISRLLVFVIAYGVAARVGPPGSAGLAAVLCHWDCGWYITVAAGGYSTETSVEGFTNLAFYPLLPLLMRTIAPVFAGNVLYAGVAIANVCFIAALFYIYRYARLIDLDRPAALLAVALLCFLPGSIVFSTALSESLFLLLLVMAMFYLRREDYLVSGVCAGLLSAVRANGILFLAFALVLMFRRHGIGSLARPWRAPERFIPLIFAPAGLFLFWGFCFLTTGDAFAQATTAHYGWYWSFLPFWHNLPLMLQTPGNAQLAACAGLATFACSCLLLRDRRYEDFLLCGAMIALILSGTGTVSVFRYWIVLFPAWIALAKAISFRPVLRIAAFALLVPLNVIHAAAWALGEGLAL
jgi:Mannosyltransferase (PIG-V)